MPTPWGGTGNEFWNTYYGGGYGSGQPSSSGYQSYPQTNATAKNAASSGGGTDNWLDWARLGLAAYQATKKPSFANQPLSPEERKLYDLYYSTLMNPALKNNAAGVNATANQITEGYKDLRWQAPTLRNGQVAGYGGSRTSFTPNAAAAQQSDIPMRTGGGSPSVGRGVHDVFNNDFQSGGMIPMPTPFGSGMTPATNASLDPNNPTVYRPPGATRGGSMNSSAGALPKGMSYGDPGQLLQFAKRWGQDGVAAITGFLNGGPAGAIVGVILSEFQRWRSGGKP